MEELVNTVFDSAKKKPFCQAEKVILQGSAEASIKVQHPAKLPAAMPSVAVNLPNHSCSAGMLQSITWMGHLRISPGRGRKRVDG